MFRDSLSVLMCTVSIFATTVNASASVTMSLSPTTSASATATQSITTGRWTVVCTTNNAASPTTFQVNCDANDDFDSITFNVGVNGWANAYIGIEDNPWNRAGDITYITRNGDGPVVLSNLNSSGTVGNIVVNSITQATIEGSVTGSIHLPVNSALQCSLNHTTIHGNLYGNVGVPAGTILGLQVDGDIGSAQAPSTITVRDNIYLLEAQSIYATVDANTEPGHWIGTFHTRGDFKGTLSASELSAFNQQQIYQRFWIEGDLDADVLIAGQIHNYSEVLPEVEIGGTIAAGRIFRTGNNLPLGAVLSVGPAHGLAGSVILNSSNSSFGWVGDVKVDGITLSPTSHGAPYYDVASSSLGGGAVGLVPFHLYGTDCDPVKNDSPTPVILDSAFNQRNPLNNSANNRSVVLRFYGPTFHPTSERPIKVEVSTGSNWEDRAGVAFIDCGNSTTTLRRDVIVHGGDGTGTFMPGEYRVTLPDQANAANRLRCAQTSAATPPEVSPFTYYFTLKSDCNGNNVDDAVDLAVRIDPNDPDSPLKYDLDGDHNIDSCERSTNGWPCPADFDTNGYVNGNDYDLFAEHFDAGC